MPCRCPSTTPGQRPAGEGGGRRAQIRACATVTLAWVARCPPTSQASAGNEGVAGDPEAERPVHGARDPDADTRGNPERARLIWRLDGEDATREVGPVVPQGDAECAREVARAGR